MMLSNNTTLNDISQMLKEPEWILAWRKKRGEEALALPRAIKNATRWTGGEVA